MNKFIAAFLTGLTAILLTAAAAGAALIEPVLPAPSLPAVQGSAVKAKPVKSASRAPQNPYMADDPKGNIHNDTWMTDTYFRKGPLGRNLVTNSGSAQLGVCATIAFDSRGRIVSICPSTLNAPQARIIDPDTLEVLATYDFPQLDKIPGTPDYQNFAAGGYFYLDQKDRIVVATKTNHLFILGQTEDGSDFRLEQDFDLTLKLDVNKERIPSALPDFRGRIWFVTKQTGKVGTFDRKTKQIRILKLGEEISNSFTVAKDGIYIASNRKLYKFTTHPNGKPKVIWKKKYRNTGKVKPGQVDAGTGTTPTVLKGGYVAITDNADPINVVVYRTANRLKGKKRVVCEVPVFKKGRSATENSLIGAGRSLMVENNYGYTNPLPPDGGPSVTEPGFSRVDVKKNGKGCRKVWTNNEVRASSVVPKLSAKTGLIYTYTRPPDPSGSYGFYWTAIDYHTGKTAWSRYAGSGLGFNNNYAGLGLGPDGTAYLGVIGGLISLRDG